MARAEELVLAVLPVIRAAEVGALGAEGDDGIVGLLDHPGGALLAEHFPAIDAVAPEGHLDRGVGDELGDVAGLHPFVFVAGFGWEEEVNEGGQAEGGADDGPQTVDGADVETTARGALNFAFDYRGHVLTLRRRTPGSCRSIV